MREKLTKAQANLLRDIQRGDDTCVKGYHPARAIVAKGLAEWIASDEYSGRLGLTPAGRAALNEARDADQESRNDR